MVWWTNVQCINTEEGGREGEREKSFEVVCMTTKVYWSWVYSK